MEQDATEPQVWVVAGCLFEVSLSERSGAGWRLAGEPPAGLTFLGEVVRGDRRNFRFRAEGDAADAGEVSIRFRGRSPSKTVVMKSVVVHVAPEKS